MIALDTSAIVAIAAGETGCEQYFDALTRNSCIVGTATLFEVHAVLQGKGFRSPLEFADEITSMANVSVTAFSRQHLQAARHAFDRYGKGRHKAGLNFGDCLAYAVARIEDCPLLFKGNDFIHTDIRPALVS